MKVALILASNTRYAPHMYHYVRILKEKNVDFDIIIWNKDNLAEENCISYDEFSDLRKSRLFRIRSYYKYSKFVQDIVNKNGYNRVVVFTIFLGMLLYPYLRNSFKRNYFFDIRDYSPILKLIPWLIKPLVENSFKTAISSPGFLEWLPKSNDYVLSHNYRFEEDFNSSSCHSVYKFNYLILTIGFLRDFEVNKMLIDSCKNSTNFTFKFVGSGLAYEPLVNFVTTNGIKNVVFTGVYDKENELEYLQNASIMNILLGDDVNSKTLMTNRFYLAISNGIPVIVNENSIQGDYVEKYNLGIVLKDNNALSETITNYFKHFDRVKFLHGSANFLSDIRTDQIKFELSFKKFITI
jgi:hypothetical protein